MYTARLVSSRKLCFTAPVVTFVNVKAEEFEDVWIHDCFYLDVAQKEHDAFASSEERRC